MTCVVMTPAVLLQLACLYGAVNTVSTTINCKLARQLCIDDQVCRSIADIVPRLCGQQLVACSTVTVTKCQAALRTLVAFPFFQPTCLCKEPRLDPECNAYRNLIFDHPCFTAKKKDKDPYPVHALPTCTYAMDVCRREASCALMYQHYEKACSHEHDRCTMKDSGRCYSAWSRLRMSPVFGCMCAARSNSSCSQVFNAVHQNPCIENSRHALHDQHLQHLQHSTSRLLHVHQPRALHAREASSSGGSWRAGVAVDAAVTVNVLAAGGGEGVSGVRDPSLVIPLQADESGLVFSEQSEAGDDKHGSSARGRGEDDDKLAGMHATLYGPENKKLLQQNNNKQQQNGYRIVSDGIPVEPEVYQSSCHVAMNRCNEDATCNNQLQPVLRHCNMDSCNRKACMQRLRNFYSSADSNITMEVAFCVCRRNPSGSDECLRAMEQLHPVCAQRSEAAAAGGATSCTHLARSCRRRTIDGGTCRHLLEQFEQSCAADALTSRCAGPAGDCRSAVVAILGTQLRTSCSCRGLHGNRLRECSSWRQLLWNNPCVDEVQRDFHRQRLQSHVLYRPTTTVTRPASPPRTANVPATSEATPSLEFATMPPWKPLPDDDDTNNTPPHAPPKVPLHRGGRPPTPGAVPGAPGGSARRKTGTGSGSQTSRYDEAETEVDTMPPAPRPRQYCVSHKQGRLNDRIPVGSGIRYYKRDDSSSDKFSVEKDCIELCMCHRRSRLVCNVLQCTPQHGCQSSMATYPHGSAGLLPYREGCVCYQGRFICMRPPSDQYTLPFGVFLFLGYSDGDESLLQPYTQRTVKNDAVSQLQTLIEHNMRLNGHDFHEWPCTIHVYQYFELTQNIIIQAKLDAVEELFNQSINTELLQLEKDECEWPLKEVSFMVNNRAAEIQSHPLLSVFKMADVEVFLPARAGGSTVEPSSCQLVLLLLSSCWWLSRHLRARHTTYPQYT